jgi:hypothetical protein
MIPKHLINIYTYLLKNKWTVEKTIATSQMMREIFEYCERDEAIDLLKEYKCKPKTDCQQ